LTSVASRPAGRQAGRQLAHHHVMLAALSAPQRPCCSPWLLQACPLPAQQRQCTLQLAGTSAVGAAAARHPVAHSPLVQGWPPTHAGASGVAVQLTDWHAGSCEGVQKGARFDPFMGASRVLAWRQWLATFSVRKCRQKADSPPFSHQPIKNINLLVLPHARQLQAPTCMPPTHSGFGYRLAPQLPPIASFPRGTCPAAPPYLWGPRAVQHLALGSIRVLLAVHGRHARLACRRGGDCAAVNRLADEWRGLILVAWLPLTARQLLSPARTTQEPVWQGMCGGARERLHGYAGGPACNAGLCACRQQSCSLSSSAVGCQALQLQPAVTSTPASLQQWQRFQKRHWRPPARCSVTHQAGGAASRRQASAASSSFEGRFILASRLPASQGWRGGRASAGPRGSAERLR